MAASEVMGAVGSAAKLSASAEHLLQMSNRIPSAVPLQCPQSIQLPCSCCTTLAWKLKSRCATAQGWKFTAITPNYTHPASFWGLRRMALTENTSHRHDSATRPVQNADELPGTAAGGGWVRGERRIGQWVLRDLLQQHLN